MLWHSVGMGAVHNHNLYFNLCAEIKVQVREYIYTLLKHLSGDTQASTRQHGFDFPPWQQHYASKLLRNTCMWQQTHHQKLCRQLHRAITFRLSEIRNLKLFVPSMSCRDKAFRPCTLISHNEWVHWQCAAHWFLSAVWKGFKTWNIAFAWGIGPRPAAKSKNPQVITP